MRILFSLVMAVVISCTIVSCGVKDVDAPTIDTSVETSVTETNAPETEGTVETTEPIEEYLHIGGMKSDVAPECKVMIKEKKNSEYTFIEDKDGSSGYALKISDKKKLSCSVSTKAEAEELSKYGTEIATGKDADTSKISYVVIKRTEPKSETEDVYFIFVDYGCKNCKMKYIATLSTKNADNDSTAKQYASNIVNWIESYCPTCCE